MSLPNYAPSGKVLFGAVPWDNNYANVRLYNSLTEQYNDIASMMSVSSEDYTYIGRNRRLKVAVEADRLYHCNYCMYRNESLTDGWIYCFITDVEYINDHTSEIALETDVFNTYLYDTDWSIPPCFIERETVPSEDSKYLLTSEPDFPLIYEVNDVTNKEFDLGGWVVATTSKAEKNNSLVDNVINPSGYYSQPSPIRVHDGIVTGASYYYCPAVKDTQGNVHMEEFDKRIKELLQGLNSAGSVESIAAIFSIPSFIAERIETIGLDGDFFMNNTPAQQSWRTLDTFFFVPQRGTTVDGYVPANKKMLYYPFNFLRLTDYNGNVSELRYELFKNPASDQNTIGIKYSLSPQCEALAFPLRYMGVENNFESGITVQCGALGSWNSQYYQNWLAQNAGSIALTIAGIALSGAVGGVAIGAAAKALSLGAKAGKIVKAGTGAVAAETKFAKAAGAVGVGSTLSAVSDTADLAAQAVNAKHQPSVTRGQLNLNTAYGTGIQGVYAQRVSVKAEIAEQIDEFFSRFGYSVERIEEVNIVSRPSWNYVKTVGSAPKSLNTGSDATAPFSRGRGTPADALAVIQNAFDNGVTFWHTTSGFGNFQLANGL